MTATAAVATKDSAEAEYVIETELLTKKYGDVIAVDQLSLKVPRGGVFGFLGPNGSGKTTTMGMLLGLVHPTSGQARIFGDPARHASTLRRVGAMVESPTFYPYMTGRANLQYFQGVSQHGSADEVERLLDIVDLGKRAGSKFATYSLGMKQRLGIACALLGDPELVFLDEPTNGLDPAGVVEVRELIRQLGTGGRTVVLSSHLLAETELVCDHVAVLARGKLIVQGNIKELLHDKDSFWLGTTDDAAAARLLSALPAVGNVAIGDGELVVTAPPANAAEITKALAQAGIYVTKLVPIRHSLESFFMDITGTDPTTGKERT
jgi:ABC-2 type transport system ATP-binding protein